MLFTVSANAQKSSINDHATTTPDSYDVYTGLEMNIQSSSSNSNISFNPTPSDNRPFGISVGYVSKQL